MRDKTRDCLDGSRIVRLGEENGRAQRCRGLSRTGGKRGGAFSLLSANSQEISASHRVRILMSEPFTNGAPATPSR